MKENIERSLVEVAYQLIKQRILEFVIYPGQVISDYIISKELSMSRTPIKQALLELKNDGLLEFSANGKGYVVNKITDKELIDLFDLREALELSAIKINMRNIENNETSREELVVELYRLNNQMKELYEKGNFSNLFYIDQQLHLYLVHNTNNSKLINAYNKVALQLERVRFLTYFETKLSSKAIEEHQSIIAAIEQKNSKSAEFYMINHLQSTLDSYINILINELSEENFELLKILMLTKMKKVSRE